MQDKALVTALVRRSALALQFAGSALRRDRELLVVAAMTHPQHICTTAKSHDFFEMWQISECYTVEDW